MKKATALVLALILALSCCMVTFAGQMYDPRTEILSRSQFANYTIIKPAAGNSFDITGSDYIYVPISPTISEKAPDVNFDEVRIECYNAPDGFYDIPCIKLEGHPQYYDGLYLKISREGIYRGVISLWRNGIIRGEPIHFLVNVGDATATLTFVTNNGTQNKDVETSCFGLFNFPDVSNLTKTGYTFMGWSDVNGSSTVDVAQDPTNPYYAFYSRRLYAVWKPVEYTIRLEATEGRFNGTTSTQNIKVNFDEVVNFPEPPVRAGYKFIGWYTEAEGGMRFTEGNTWNVAQSGTLYAHWEKKNIALILDPCGGTVNPDIKTVHYREAYGELPTPVNGDKTFNGWFTEKQGGTQVKSDTIVTTEENHTIYAQWSGGTTERTATEALLIKGNTTAKTMTYDYRTTVTYTVDIPDGCTAQWYVNNTGKGTANSITVEESKEDYDIRVEITDADGNVKYDTQHIVIKHGFFDMIIWFFKHLFKPDAYVIIQK